jgi:L-threonylcarbamoyladenylate synthase
MNSSRTNHQDNPMPAVFLDRDGTLIEDRGHLRDPGEVVFYPDTAEALRRLQKEFRLFIVTNQSGIGKGLISLAEAERVNRYVVERLRLEGVRIEQVYCCSHRRDELCACIKPNPLFLKQASQDYNLNLSRSFTVGDHPHDVQLADPVGATGLYVMTGHGRQHRRELPAETTVVQGIREAADWIIASQTLRYQKQQNPGLIKQAAHLLNQGGVVAFPTETVYGLGADAFNAEAVARIFEIKQRPHFDPLIVHVCTSEQLSLLVTEIPAAARALIDHFWPGPLTLVLPKNPAVPDLVTAGLPSVAVRMPGHPLALELIRQANTPIAAPSANRFGCTSPTTAQHVLDQLGTRVDRIVDGGSCSVGIESTIISLLEETPVLLRAGGIAMEEIERVIGPVQQPATCSSDRPVAPGQLSRHYAPRTPLVFCESGIPSAHTMRAGLLAFRQPEHQNGFAAMEVLSAGGNLREAAANLFAAIHRLDAMSLDCIYAEQFPDTGLGRAINDRLRRAAHRSALDSKEVRL